MAISPRIPEFGFQPKAPRIKLIVTGAVVLAVVLLLVSLNPLYEVNAGYVGVRTAFGAAQQGVLYPGLHWRTPLIATITEVNVQPNTSTTQETAATHDQQNVATSTAVTFQVDPLDAVYIYQNFRDIDTLQARIIGPTVSNDVKAVVSNYDAQELITKRELVGAEIKDRIASDLAKYHVLIDAVNIVDLKFSDDYNAAIEAKQIAQQDAQKAQYVLQQVKTNAQQQVVTAQASADAAVATAQGAAKATVLQAQADAEAYKLKQQGLSPEILQLQAIQKWNGAMPQYLGAGAPLPFLSVPTHAAGQAVQK